MKSAEEESRDKTSGNPNFGQDAIPALIGNTSDKTVVEARFYVSEVKLQPFSEYDLDENNKSINHRQVMGGTITMSAAKHGTFGKYTPFGSITMGIQNLYAFEVFKEAFERNLKYKGRNSRFRVYFVEDENQEPDK